MAATRRNLLERSLPHRATHTTTLHTACPASVPPAMWHLGAFTCHAPAPWLKAASHQHQLGSPASPCCCDPGEDRAPAVVLNPHGFHQMLQAGRSQLRSMWLLF